MAARFDSRLPLTNDSQLIIVILHFVEVTGLAEVAELVGVVPLEAQVLGTVAYRLY